jgi:predicted 3-demethylubiquinone-9 3-methyltransferase (glyoxalase superfamily)
MIQKITPNLWFDTQAEEAANFYVSIFPNSRIVSIGYYNDAVPSRAGQVVTVEFELEGQRFTAINGGPEFTFTEAVSLMVNCETQDEIDYYWEKLQSDGGQDGPCGWLKDRYGLSWQVAPAGIDRLYADATSAGAARAMRAMMGMRKLDMAALQAAAEGVPVR